MITVSFQSDIPVSVGELDNAHDRLVLPQIWMVFWKGLEANGAEDLHRTMSQMLDVLIECFNVSQKHAAEYIFFKIYPYQ